jgi:hypothetical protein
MLLSLAKVQIFFFLENESTVFFAYSCNNVKDWKKIVILNGKLFVTLQRKIKKE